MLPMKKTYVPKKEGIERRWLVVDATGQTLGRLATRVATLLRGKGKPYYTPHMDTGDFVVVVNAARVRVTGKKLTDKIYYHHTGFRGGLRSAPLAEMLARKPEFVVTHAVRGMLPKTKLGRRLLKKLKVYAGPTHPHQAQRPQTINL